MRQRLSPHPGQWHPWRRSQARRSTARRRLPQPKHPWPLKKVSLAGSRACLLAMRPHPPNPCKHRRASRPKDARAAATAMATADPAKAAVVTAAMKPAARAVARAVKAVARAEVAVDAADAVVNARAVPNANALTLKANP